MDVVNFNEAEAYAAAVQSEEPAYGAKYANIFTTFQDLLTASGDDNSCSAVETTATAMANFIREVGRQDSDPMRESLVDACWDNMMRMVDGIPLNHPWHAIFVRTIHILHGLVGEPIYSQPGYIATWDGLAELQYHFWDFWDGRMMRYLLYARETDNKVPERNLLAGPEKDNEVIRWKRWTSMFAQMPCSIALPYYTMRAIQALESPADANTIDAECTLWTACEWLIHRAYQALECLRAHAIDKDELTMGDLYRRDVGDPCSWKRWDWWKHRLRELAADTDAETKQHVARALASMEAAEARPSEVEELEKEEKRKEEEEK